MIVYADSSIITRAYLGDERGHREARAMVENTDNTVITGSWTRIEVTGALIRSARSRGRESTALLAAFEADAHAGVIHFVDSSQAEVELIALAVVRRHGIRAMDAWHLACASLAFADLAEPNEELGFATRDADQAAVARDLGFVTL